jgi:hypothetical protein
MANEDPGRPEIVYHYTSTEAMMQIVDRLSIWATAISYLNDTTERQYVMKAVTNRLPERNILDNSIPASLDIESTSSYRPKALTLLAKETFVTSFSVYKDSLMHWRAYCPQQSGVAIGFSTACLDKANIDEKSQAGMVVAPVGFGKIRYVDVSLQEDVDRLIDDAKLIATFQSTQLGNITPGCEYMLRFREFFRYAVEAIACSSKHSSFQPEGEYRLLLSNIEYRENNLKFRPVRSTLVPYVPLHIPSRFEATGDIAWKGKTWDAVANVVIGPTANMELTERAIKSFFGMKGMDVNVERSKIPYRDW